MKYEKTGGRPKIILDKDLVLSLLEKFENSSRKNPYTWIQFAADLNVSKSRLLTEIRRLKEEQTKSSSQT
jgi:hypothetical protein